MINWLSWDLRGERCTALSKHAGGTDRCVLSVIHAGQHEFGRKEKVKNEEKKAAEYTLARALHEAAGRAAHAGLSRTEAVEQMLVTATQLLVDAQYADKPYDGPIASFDSVHKGQVLSVFEMNNGEGLNFQSETIESDGSKHTHAGRVITWDEFRLLAQMVSKIAPQGRLKR